MSAVGISVLQGGEDVKTLSLSQLDAEHASLSGRLEELKHRQWRASLPAGYTPLSRSAAANLPLQLSARERVELDTEIEIVQRRILRIAAAIHERRFGKVPGWLRDALKVVIACAAKEAPHGA